MLSCCCCLRRCRSGSVLHLPEGVPPGPFAHAGCAATIDGSLVLWGELHHDGLHVVVVAGFRFRAVMLYLGLRGTPVMVQETHVVVTLEGLGLGHHRGVLRGVIQNRQGHFKVCMCTHAYVSTWFLPLPDLLKVATVVVVLHSVAGIMAGIDRMLASRSKNSRMIWLKKGIVFCSLYLCCQGPESLIMDETSS